MTFTNYNDYLKAHPNALKGDSNVKAPNFTEDTYIPDDDSDPSARSNVAGFIVAPLLVIGLAIGFLIYKRRARSSPQSMGYDLEKPKAGFHEISLSEEPKLKWHQIKRKGSVADLDLEASPRQGATRHVRKGSLSYKPGHERKTSSGSQDSIPEITEYTGQDRKLSDQPAKRAIALYNFQPRTLDELTFLKGDVIMVTACYTDGWGKGYVKGGKPSDARVFPLNYVTPV